MIDHLRALGVFAKIAETGSFRAAGKALDLSPSVVSRYLTQLEEHTGTSLMRRSTRNLSLTADGQVLLQAAEQMMDAAERGLDSLGSRASEPVGALALTAPAMFAAAPLTIALAEFALKHPRIDLTLNFTDVRRYMTHEGYDLAIRVGWLESSALKATLLTTIERRLVASSDFMADRLLPENLKDIDNWDWIRLEMRRERPTIFDPDGVEHTMVLRPRILVDNITVSYQLAN